MSQEVQGMLIQIEATTAQLRREMAQADQVVNRTTRQIDSSLGVADAAFDRTAQKAQQAGTLIRGAFAAIAGAGLVGGMIRQIDAVGQMDDRMRELTGSSFEYSKVQQALLATAKDTYRPLAEAQELYLLTADSIKSLGYNTQQTLDITDSFSYLLVTNSASADKAASALDAYSTALMTNKVGADQWRSIIRAMPTVVDALAEATGRSVEEIKRLGIEGKLSVDDLNKGFLQTVESNRAAAARMRASVSDALTNINTAIGVYLGNLEESTGAAAGLADALGVIADNIEVVAAVVGGVAAGAMAAYSAKALIATAETLRGIKAAVADRAARIAQADATLQAAIADQRKAQTATILAQREAIAAKGTAVQTQMSIQLAQARQREAAATAAVATAQAGLRTASAGLLAVLGGPVGLALMAGTAAASFLLLRDNSGEARISLEEIKRPVQELREEFQGLARDQREAALLRWQDEQARAVEEVKDAYAEMGAALRQALVDQSDARSPGYVQQLQQYQELINRLDQAREAGEGLAPILRDIAASSGIPSETLESLIKQAGALSESDDKAARLAEILRVLTADLEVNTAAVSSNAAAHGQLSKSASDYIAAIEKRTAAIEDGNDPIKQATRHIEEHGKYTEDEAKAILKAAEAQKAAQDARAKATEGRKTSNKAIDEQIKAIDALIAKYDPAAKAQAEYEKGIALADEALRKNKYTSEQYQKVVQGLYTDLNKPIWDKFNEETRKADEAIKKIDDQLESVRDRLDPVRAATKRLTAEKKLFKEQLDAGNISLEEYQLRLRQLDDEYARNQKSTSQWTEWTESALERVDSAFADAWRNIGDGFSSFRDSLTNAFKQMLAELAHMAITRPIVLQLGAMMGVGNGTQGNNGIWGGLLGSGSSSGGGYGVQDGLSTISAARNAYSLYSVGLAGMANTWGGYLAGAGNMLGMTGLGNFGIGMQGATLAPGLAGPTTIGAGGSMGAGAQVGSGLSSMGGLMANPATWIAAGMIASAKFYDQGYRLDTEDVAQQRLNKISFGIDPALASVLNLGVKTTELATKLLGGGKIANILTGGSFIAGITSSVNKALFGGDWKTKDYGVGLSIADGDFGARQFEYRKKKGGLFSSSKKKTIWRDLDPETAAALQETYDATESGVASLFEALSLSIDEGSLDGLQLARKQISTKGKTEEQIQEAIGEWFASAAEAMNAELNRVLETGLDLDLDGMRAFVSNLLGVNETLRYLDVDMFDASVAGGKLAESLSAAAGGLEALATSSATYYSAFFSDAEKVEDTIDSITRAFEAADVELVGSREAYRAMVEDIDLTTEAGQEMFATLMALSGQAAQYFSIVEQQAAAAAQQAAAAAQQAAYLTASTAGAAVSATQGALNSLSAAINAEKSSITSIYQAQANSIRSAIGSANESLSEMRSVAGSLRSAVNGLRLESEQYAAQSRRSAQQTIGQALSGGGRIQMTAQLERALDTVSQSSEDLFGSFEDYARDYWQTYFAIESLADKADDQLTAEERTVKALESQLDQAQRFHDAQIERLDSVLDGANAQLEALLGIDTSVQSVETALAAFSAALAAAQQLQNANSSITSVTGLAGVRRQVTSDGYILDELGNQMELFGEAMRVVGNKVVGGMGASLNIGADGQLSWGAGDYEKWAKSVGIPGFASGGLHSGGLRIVGENGPELEVTGPSRIYNASQTAAMLGGGSETASEVRALRTDFAGMMDALRSVAKHTMQTAKRVEFLERWDYDGLPTERATV